MLINKEERVAKAVALFHEGYNCAQSVAGAFADLYGFKIGRASCSDRV